MSIKTKQYTIHEDWTVVILGFLIIGISLFIFLPEVPVFKWENATDLLNNVFDSENLQIIGLQSIYLISIGTIGAFLTGKSVKNFLFGFPIVYVLTVIALIIAGNTTIKGFNLEAVIFSLIIGLAIGNFFKLPEWFRSALATEVFVKIGLVILGTSVIFSDILKAGTLGLAQALVVVLSVWYFAFWLCKKLKVDDELTMMISSAVSICGVSAAIATSGAIKGDSKKLSYVISMVLVTAIPMMIFMPIIAKYFNFPEEVTGAWLGGSIDTSGAVVASGSLVGETALKISTIVKFSQNVLLGLAAFAISVYWTYTHNKSAEAVASKPTLGVIWERFPKFVIGFIAASLVFSFLLTPEVRDQVKDSLKNLQGIWFALAFTSIGLETNFKDLLSNNSKKPLYAFLIAQLFNVIITLIIAFLLFSK
ncbi:putative sulfate exporter family transporter [Flavobacterium sp. LS1R47]|uniref:Sulfate exporter family transporter n=1 Tax=Flavobacterium frigoritolerans TaxID=2987686 RepID=A0A9X3C1Y6_9FLAO|nr:putative sulfate exporter family transporter [Flavobacterium frigoritolerans]MCV9933281.1 putative sulfate exporter family transporter [Flavobacterium frigoritolerans]